MKEILKELSACQEAIDWAENKSIEEIINTCHRGDWLLWLAHKLDVDLQPLTLAKGLCANTVRHLMKDERSVKAVDIAIAFGKGNATRQELDAAAADAADAAYTAAYAAAAAAYAASAADAAAYADAAYTAVYAAAAYAYAAAYTADAADASAAASAAAKKENQQQTADICREILGEILIEKLITFKSE